MAAPSAWQELAEAASVERRNKRLPPRTHPITMRKIHKPMAKLIALLLAINILPAGAQNRDRNDNRDNRNNQTFYNGVRSGGRGGQYSDPRYNNGRYKNGQYKNGQYKNGQYNNGRYDNGQYNNGQYNNGQYDNGQYNNGQYNNGQYNNGQYDNGHRNKGGIGPGKGALIGGAGGAVLGALFGKGIKGAIIGGAAGAGIGAVIGEAHQNHVNNQYPPR